jgi:hypothetical protein
MIIFEILSPRPRATNYAAFKNRDEAEATLANDKIRFPDFSGYRISEFEY